MMPVRDQQRDVKQKRHMLRLNHKLKGHKCSQKL